MCKLGRRIIEDLMVERIAKNGLIAVSGMSIEELTDAFVKGYKLVRSCGDANDRAEAIKIASGYCCPANAARELAKLPPVTPQPKTGHWIPVTERLPEENGYYLTTTMYNEVYCDYWEEDRFNRTEAVIAWMPLPKPYEPQERSDKE